MADIIVPEALTPQSKNAHYGRLNERFDERAKVLYGLGFQYQSLDGYNIAIFTRKHPYRYGQQESLPAAFVLSADSLVWTDRLRELQSR